MSLFIMFGKASPGAVEDVGPGRTRKAQGVIKELGGEIRDVYLLLGDPDLVMIVDLPSVEQAMKASIALTKMSGVSFTTSPAVTVEDFDKFTADM